MWTNLNWQPVTSLHFFAVNNFWVHSYKCWCIWFLYIVGTRLVAEAVDRVAALLTSRTDSPDRVRLGPQGRHATGPHRPRHWYCVSFASNSFAANLLQQILNSDQTKRRPCSNAEPEWPNGLQLCAAARTLVDWNPTNSSRYMICVDQKVSAAKLTFVQSAGHTPEVNIRVKQGIHPDFETRGKTWP